MLNEVRCRTRKQISFEKLCEVVDYGEESLAGNDFARDRRSFRSVGNVYHGGTEITEKL